MSKSKQIERVVVTGGMGMIGSHVVDECVRRGWETTVIDINSRAATAVILGGKVRYVCGDIANIHERDLKQLGESDVVFHLAAEPFIPDGSKDPFKMLRSNVLGTEAVLKAANMDCRVVFISSSEVYGGDLDRPLFETDAIQPHSFYATTKAAGEHLCKIALYGGKDVVIFRPFNTYGPHCVQPYVIPTIISQLMRSRFDSSSPTAAVMRLGRTNTSRDFSYVSDTARAIVETAINGVTGETYHFGSGMARSIKSVVQDVCQTLILAGLIEAPNCLEYQTDQSKLRPWDVESLCAWNGKIDKILPPWRRVTWMDGLLRTVKWFAEQGMKWPWE